MHGHSYFMVGWNKWLDEMAEVSIEVSMIQVSMKFTTVHLGYGYAVCALHGGRNVVIITTRSMVFAWLDKRRSLCHVHNL